MAVKDGSDFDSKSESWNIAQHYVFTSFAFVLKELNELERIARTGFLKIGEDIVTDIEIVSKKRSDSIRTYFILMEQMMVDAYFKLKSNRDRGKTDIISMKMNVIRDSIWGKIMKRISESPEDHHYEIDEYNLTKYMDKLRTFKGEFQYLMDRAGLIFRIDKEPDIDEIKREIFENG